MRSDPARGWGRLAAIFGALLALSTLSMWVAIQITTWLWRLDGLPSLGIADLAMVGVPLVLLVVCAGYLFQTERIVSPEVGR